MKINICHATYIFGKEFSNHYNLSTHKRDVHKSKKCLTCDKMFKLRLECTQCNFVSEHKSSINRHSRLVHGDKYKCDQCGKKIPLSTAEKHKELHGKQYECNLCRKFFKLSNSFEWHVAKQNPKTVDKKQHNCSNKLRSHIKRGCQGGMILIAA